MRIRTFTFILLFTSRSLYSQSFNDFLSRVNSSPESQRTTIVDSFMTAVKSFPFLENDTTVHFIYRGSVNSVNIPGDMNGWSTNALSMSPVSTTDLWYRTEKFESDARLDYKFVLNGSNWILDPRNSYQVTGGFGPNSELRMPKYIPAKEIQYDPNIPHGNVRDTTFYNTSLKNSRTIKIYTPPGYDTSAISYPMILFHDGLEYISLAQANNVIDELIEHNKISPIIAVFVPPVNRTSEYAGNQITQFSSFIVSELLPFIESHYRVKRGPQYRATLGASNGGNIALYLGYNHPDVFGNVAAQSSNIISAISSGFQTNLKLNLKLYLDLGTYDLSAIIPLVKNFIPILKSKGYEYEYHEYHEGHSWGSWRAHIDDALIFFFGKITSKVNEQGVAPMKYELKQNYPNPFSRVTTIHYSIPKRDHVTLKVYDCLGREVATLVDGEKDTGTYNSTFDILNSKLNNPSAIYFVNLSDGIESKTNMMVYVR